MKISLNTRRTSPPLNMAQNSQSSRNLVFMLQFDRRTASSLLFYYFSFKDISKAKLKEDLSSSGYGSLGVFINQKCKTSSCHFLKIYMKISLNNRRTSPPLNILKILKEVFTWNFIFQLDRMTASSFYNF